MTFTLSRLEYDDLWRSCPASKTQTSGDSETLAFCPDRLGSGYIRTFHLRDINLTIFDYQLRDDLVVVDEDEPGTTWLEFGFNISGNRSGKRTGQSFAEWGTDMEGGTFSYETLAEERVFKVDIHLTPHRQFSDFMMGDFDRFPPELKRWLDGDDCICYSEVNSINPAMRQALNQILLCPYQGTTRQIYLESRCLELVALKLEQLAVQRANGETETKRQALLKPDDIDRIYLAAEILTASLEQPPSLIELSRQVNLNDYKLKVGFRQLFGTTVFGYLHQHRMAKARHLLAEQQMTVGEVAQAVGYASQSRFAAAFRKQFGVNPKSYTLGRKSG